VSLIAALLLALQAPDPDPAVRKGIEFLKSRTEELGESRDVVLWTFVRAQVPEADPALQRLLKNLLARPLETTRSVALQAMILQELDSDKHRLRIAQCAQFLIDSQGADGQWDAGRAIPLPEIPIAPPELPPLKPQGPAGMRNFGGAPPKPKFPKLQLKKQQQGPEKGNPTDSRWALWGLLDAHRAGILPPVEVPARAERAWRDADADAGEQVSGLCIALYLQGKNYKQDRDVLKGLERLADPQRPNDPVSLSLAKVAMIHADTDRLGQEWWVDRNKTVVATQQGDGSWGSIDDTCAAIRCIHVWRLRGLERR
jgi:hypothetical protein